MYVQGVSTRKVAEITKELCGLDVSSSQVSRAAELLDEELEAWAQSPAGQDVLPHPGRSLREGASMAAVCAIAPC